MKFVGKLWRARRGATAIEYGLIVALIAIAALGSLQVINGKFGSMWANLADKVPANQP